MLPYLLVIIFELISPTRKNNCTYNDYEYTYNYDYKLMGKLSRKYDLYILLGMLLYIFLLFALMYIVSIIFQFSTSNLSRGIGEV